MNGEIKKLCEIDEEIKLAMYELFSRQFDKVSFVEFTEDLQQKNWVLLLRAGDGALTGFSSLHVYDTTIDGKNLTVVYSGDTVVDPATWRDSALSYYWMGAIDYLRRVYGRHELFWFLLVSGYRTYRFLPVYSDYYFPRAGRETPKDMQAVLDGLARDRFGERYDAAAGIVRLRVPAVLKDDYRGIPERRLTDPHIAYFAARNPGHEAGDELVCGAVLSDDNLTPLGRRIWMKGRKLFADKRDK